jgi:hypothetical protein
MGSIAISKKPRWSFASRQQFADQTSLDRSAAIVIRPQKGPEPLAALIPFQ